MMLIVDVWYDIDIDHANIESMKSYILTNLTLFQNIFLKLTEFYKFLSK